MSDLKMYFLIKDSIDIGHAVNGMGHAGAMIERNWPEWKTEAPYMQNVQDTMMTEWWTSFRKCTCKVTQKQFDKAKTYGDYFIVTESFYDDAEVILVMKPRREWPKFFNFLPLYK